MASARPARSSTLALFSQCVGEPAHVAQLRGPGPSRSRTRAANMPAGFDRAELGLVIADEDHLGPGRSCGPHQLVEGEGAGQAGLVDDHQLVRLGAASGPLRASACGDALARAADALPGRHGEVTPSCLRSSLICAAARLPGGARRATWPCSPCRCRARRPAPRPRRPRGPGRAPSPPRARLPTPPAARPSWWTCPSRPGRPRRQAGGPRWRSAPPPAAWSRDNL